MPPSEPAATVVADSVPAQSPSKPPPRRKPRTVSTAQTQGDETVAAVIPDVVPRKRSGSKPRSKAALSSDIAIPVQSEPTPTEQILPRNIAVIDHPAAVPISQAQAVLSRTLGAGRYATLMQSGLDALLELRLSKLPPTEPDPYRALVLHGPAGDIELSDGIRLLMAMTGIDLGESAVDLPESQWLNASALGRLASTPLRDIISLSRGCLIPNPDLVALSLTLRSTHHAFSVTAKASAVCWLDFLAHGDWLHRGRMIENQLDLPLTIPWRIGTHTLVRAALAELVPGDIVLPETCWFDCSGTGLVHIGDWQLSVTHTAPAGMTLLVLETRMDHLGTIVDTDSLVIDASFSGANSASGLDTLPLQLHFDMGCCRTTLGGLRSLVAGSVLPIEGGSPAAISISSGGHILGQGELVDVNGQLAIRITYWS